MQDSIQVTPLTFQEYEYPTLDLRGGSYLCDCNYVTSFLRNKVEYFVQVICEVVEVTCEESVREL